MLLFRWLLFLMLIGAGVCFVFYVGTGQSRYRRWGLKLLQWALLAAFAFFGVLILERVV